MEFFGEVKSLNELNEERQKLFTQIGEDYKKAYTLLKEAEPKFRKARILPISGLRENKEMAFGMFRSSEKSTRSPLLIISNDGFCNY